MQDSIDIDAIQDVTSVRTIEHHAVIDSTNRRAGQRLKDDPELPLLVVADEQTSGRGRGSNAWWSPQGCLMFSLAMRRTESHAQLPPYSLAVGLGVRAATAARLPGHDVKVKWPNDVYVGARKISGVLIEIPPGDSGTLVIGIGINVNNSTSEAPEEVASTVATMRDLGGEPFSRVEVLCSVLRSIEVEIANVSLDLPGRWHPHCYLSGRTVTVNRGPHCDRGVCCGIDATGAMLLQTKSGTIAVSSGTVRFESS